MMIPIYISIILFISFYDLLPNVGAKPPETLTMVHYIFRHGERTPDGTYKGDPNPPSTWPKGYLQLTQHGIQTQYELGQYFRKRYDGFVSETYFSNETRVRSTYKERCLMSASAHLAGLYPPKGIDLWKKDLKWQPIPVFTRPLSMDHEIYEGGGDCPVKRHLEEDYRHSEEFRKQLRPFDSFFEFMSKKLDTDFNIDNAEYMYDVLKAEKDLGRPVPGWVNQTIMQKLKTVYIMQLKSRAGTRKLQRLAIGGGPFIKDMLDRMRAKIAGNLNPDYKLYIYSDHDVSLVGFLVSLGMYNDIPPAYCSTIIIELHKIEESYFLKILYKNDTSKDPMEMQIPHCGNEFCPFSKFVDLTRDIVPVDIEKECQYDKIDSGHIFLAVIVGLLLAFVIVQCCTIFLLCRKGRRFGFDKLP